MTRGNTSIGARLYQGYSRAFVSLLQLLLFLLSIAVVSFLFTFPLWYWALHHTRSFTSVVLLLVLAFSIFILFTRVKTGILRKRRDGLSYAKILRGPLFALGKVVVLLLFIYIFLSLIAASFIFTAVLTAIIALIVLGLLFFSQ